MMKDAEHRYQSSQGILYDLHHCMSIMKKRANHILVDYDVFTLGRRDFSERFQVSKALYGRTKQLRLLLELFDDVRNGGADVVFVGGQSGSGKTALINEIRRPVQMRSGLLISGKFSQQTSNTAYTALIDALHQIVRYILTENQDKLDIWKQKIQRALGNQTKLIMDVLPELARIIDQNDDLDNVISMNSSQDNKHRFMIAFRDFLKVFATEQNPLVLFLDDIQVFFAHCCLTCCSGVMQRL
jgi:predicted ATPase